MSQNNAPTDFDLLAYKTKCYDTIADIEEFLSNIDMNKQKLFSVDSSLEYSFSQLEGKLESYSQQMIVDVVTKVDWLLETSTYWRGATTKGFLDVIDETHIDNHLYGKRLSQLIQYFELSPLETLDISWSQIFGITAVQQMCLLYKFHFKCDTVERLALNQLGISPSTLVVDITDCVAKSVVFGKLLDDGWVNGYKSRKAAFAKVKKTLPLKQEVLQRYNERYKGVDDSSAGSAILIELQEQRPELLKLLKEGSKMERTFATWIKEARDKPQISTFF